MPSWLIAWRNIRTRAVQSALTVVIIAVAVALSLTIGLLAGGVRRGLMVAGGPFELVVGPKGSPTQLVTSGVLLQDVPIGNLTLGDYRQLAADARVRDALPIALGDNIRGARIVGTVPAMFDIALTPGQGLFYRIADGQAFAADFEAVLGSTAAQRLGLRPGQQFLSTHGVLEGVNETEHLGLPYTVVGVLAPTGTPFDSGVFVSLGSYWHTHGLTRGTIATPGGALSDQTQANAPPDLGITAVLLRGRDLSASYQLYQQINASQAQQAALPGQVLVQLIDLLGQGQQLLALLSAVALGMAVLSTALSLYNAVLSRQHEIAVLRALGAPRRTVIGVVLWEVLLICGLGVLLGALLGIAAAFGGAAAIGARSAVAVPIVVGWGELGTAAITLALGLLAGALPALRAYRVQAAAVLGS